MPRFPPYIKQLLAVILPVSGLLLLVIYAEHVNRPRPHPGPGHMHEAAETYAFSGLVARYGSNNAGDIDKMLVRTGNSSLWIHFPPHTAGQVTQLAPEQTRVHLTVNERREHPRGEAIPYELVYLLADITQRSFSPQAVPPPDPEPGKEIALTDSAIRFNRNEAGAVSGFILQHHFIALDPHHLHNLLPMLQQARSITVKGYERDTSAGFVNESGLNVIKPYSITIDKTAYRLQ